MKEKWKPAPGYESHFEVSDLGNVRRKDGDKYTDISGWKNYSGYMQVHLRIKELGVNKYVRTHRLVALAFIPNPENKPQINHINGKKTDNKAVNLEWVTAKENTNHAEFVLHRKFRRFKSGGRHTSSKLRAPDILWIYKHKDLLSKKEMARELDVCKSTIFDILLGRRWQEMFNKYKDKYGLE